MERGTQLVIGVGVGAAALAGGIGYLLGTMRAAAPDTAALQAPALEPSTDASRLEAELRAKELEIERLTLAERRFAERVGELETPRAPAATDTTTVVASDPDPSLEPPTHYAGGSAAAAAIAWLRGTELERLAGLSDEELALIDNLSLRGAKLTDQDLAHLAALVNLRALELRGTAVTDAGMAYLRGLTQLESLEVRGTELTGAALRDLPTSRLKALHLTDTKVRCADLFGMPPMAQLETLKLNRLDFGDEHVGALAPFPSVRHLELDGTALTDAGLERLLAQNPALARIELRGTEVTEERVQQLGALYPDCEFVLDQGPGVVLR